MYKIHIPIQQEKHIIIFSRHYIYTAISYTHAFFYWENIITILFHINIMWKRTPQKSLYPYKYNYTN